MQNVKVIDHPLIQHKLSLLRDKTTSTKDFREIIKEVSMLIAYEVTRDLPVKEVELETPMGIARTKIISGKKIGLVPILRAGLGMVDGMISLLPMAKVGHIGLYREKGPHDPVLYYCKLPVDVAERDIILLEPMLATGGSASYAVTYLQEKGVKNIKIMCLIASRKGLTKVNSEHPDVEIFCAAIDEETDSEGYIIPGLGDCGDRLFGTR